MGELGDQCCLETLPQLLPWLWQQSQQFLSSMITTSQASIKISRKIEKSCLFSQYLHVQMLKMYDIYTIHQDSLRPESAGSLLPLAVALLLGRSPAKTSPGFPSWASRKDRMSEAEAFKQRGRYRSSLVLRFQSFSRGYLLLNTWSVATSCLGR